MILRRVRISDADRQLDPVSAVRRRAESLGRTGREVARIASDATVAKMGCQVATGDQVARAHLLYAEELAALYTVVGRGFSDADRAAILEVAHTAIAEADERATNADQAASVALRRGWLALVAGDWTVAAEVAQNTVVPREEDGTHPGRIMSLMDNLDSLNRAAYTRDAAWGRRALLNSNRFRHQERAGLESQLGG